MKVGVITDTHLGIDNSVRNEIIEKLTEIKSSFESENVENVIHLGDMIHESGNSSKNIEEISNIFSDFNRYFTPGNHDVIETNLSEFEDKGWKSPKTVNKEGSRITIMIDSSSNSKHKNIGYISQDEFLRIRKLLHKGYDINIISHYPIEKIEFKYDLFNTIPERAYPINKDELFLKCDHREYEGCIKNQFCGHLHPKKSYVSTGSPTNIKINVIEPVLYLELTNKGVNMNLNKNINAKNLIFEI